jgi:hypothetical protein
LHTILFRNFFLRNRLYAIREGCLYDNLAYLYATYEYSPSCIWNCDESGVQAGKNGGAYVLAKTGSRSVHQVVPDEQE